VRQLILARPAIRAGVFEDRPLTGAVEATLTFTLVLMTVKRWTRRNTSQASDGQARSADLRLAGRPTPKWLAGRSCTGRNRGRGRATSYVSGHGRRLLLGTDNRVRLWEAFARSIAVRNVARAVGLRPLRPGELTAVQPVRDDSGRPSRVTSRFRLLVLSNGAAPHHHLARGTGASFWARTTVTMRFSSATTGRHGGRMATPTS
jgi:hypothetical protein